MDNGYKAMRQAACGLLLSLATSLAWADILYVHTDHLNTPRLATDETGTVVWRNLPTTEPFGNSPVEEDPDGDSTNTTLNQRFPGQYADRETNLHYNGARFYDPATGRYQAVDPQGLNWHINPYSYAHFNPLSYYDPTGEAATLAWCFGGPVGCAIGATAAVGSLIWAQSKMSKAKTGAGASLGNSAFCPPGDQDPCKGLRDILKEHEDKLRDYLNDPLGNDNKGMLAMAYLSNNGAIASSIYEGRIRNLQNQIANFKKQLEECERANGKK